MERLTNVNALPGIQKADHLGANNFWMGARDVSVFPIIQNVSNLPEEKYYETQ